MRKRTFVNGKHILAYEKLANGMIRNYINAEWSLDIQYYCNEPTLATLPQVDSALKSTSINITEFKMYRLEYIWLLYI